MATIKLIQRPDLIKKADGNPTAIYAAYCYQGITKRFNTGEKVENVFWSEKDQQVKLSYVKAKGKEEEKDREKIRKNINANISKFKSGIEDIISKAHYSGIEPTLEYVEEQIKSTQVKEPEQEKNFYALYEQYLEENKNKKAKGTLTQQRGTLNHIKSFEKAKKYKITLETIDLNFYSKFTDYLITREQQAPNTIGKHIKHIKAFLNDLTDKGINSNVAYKSKKFKKTSAPTHFTYLSQQELDKLFTFDLSNKPKLDRTRDLFVFECVTGLRYSDIENLKSVNIKKKINESGEESHYLEYTTIKTRDKLIANLNSYSLQILLKNNGTLPKAVSNQKANDALKELCKYCGIDTPEQKVKYIGSKRIEETVPKYELISTHTARRTFITLSLEQGIRPEIIMQRTGHKDIKTMMKYVKITSKIAELEMSRAFANAPKLAEQNLIFQN